MANLTPKLGDVGHFTVKLPWTISDSKRYTVIAVRTFDDVYKTGKDVYDTIYKPMGLVEGVPYNGTPFVFEAERLLKPNVISLQDPEGAIIYVPDTYITSYPSVNDVAYQLVILSVSLGPLPVTCDVEPIKAMVADMVSTYFGKGSTCQINVIPVTDTPNAVQHTALEAARLALPLVSQSTLTQLKAGEATLTAANQQIATLTTMLRNAGLI